MKELLTISANFCASYTDDGKLLPQVEIILVMTEPVYSVDACGEVCKQRGVEQVRFAASPKQLKRLAATLIKLADEAEALPQLPEPPKP